jgi:hypothetical protein
VSLLETQGKEAIGINRPRVSPKNGIKTSLYDLKDLKETTITNPHAARKHRPPSGVIMPILSALCAFIAVAMGAFGAHGLKTILTPDMLAVYKTAVTYQMK